MTYSRIYLSEGVPNKDRKFGSDVEYAPCWVYFNATWVPALFTAPQIKVALDRAGTNPEDVRPRAGYFRNLLHALLGR